MKRKMKIAILGSRGIPNAYGGFEQCAQYLSRGLVERGHEVWVYNSSSHPYRGDRWQGVRIVHRSDPEEHIGTAGQFIYDLLCLRHARSMDYEVIIQLGYTSSSIWYGLWPKRARHLVNMDGLEHQRSKYSRPVQRFLRWAEKLATLRADLLVADNPAIQRYLGEHYPEKPVRYIPYGAEIPAMHTAGHLGRWELETGAFDLVICRMEPENHVETILAAHREHEGKEKLVIVGNTEHPYGRKLTSTYRSRGVIFTGSIYNKEILDSLRHHCRIYFHGHSVGGTNPSLLEAMASGSLIAAHDNPFNRNVLGNDACYFQCRQDVEDLLGKPPGPPSTEQWREANLEKIRKEYTWSNVIKAYEAACYAVAED